MAVKARSERSASPVLIGTVVTVLVLFLGWLAYANLIAPPRDPPLSAKQQQNQEWMKDFARRTHGDPGRFTPADQAEFNQHTGGSPYAIAALKKIANENGYDH